MPAKKKTIIDFDDLEGQDLERFTKGQESRDFRIDLARRKVIKYETVESKGD